MMSRFKLKFKLKQHTPLIHFQYDQSGATLRSTELKPKLDKFFKAKGLNLPYGEHGELDYKTKIIAKFETKNAIEIQKRDPLFFGNMGDGKDKFFVSAENKRVDIEFFAFTKEIRQAIDEYFAEFLMKTNFGTRQSKGFGSFYIDEADEKKYKKPEDVLAKDFYLFFRKNGSVFENIAVIYNLMKSGINFPDHPMINYRDSQGIERRRPDPDNKGDNQVYYKSFLSQYFLNKKIGNEKHFIKEKFFRPQVRISPDGWEKKYIRAMLGVAAGVEFKDGKRRGRIEYISDEIERFKSPIIFKVINDYVFMLTVKIPETMNNQKFVFSDSRSQEDIYTPDDLNLKVFLKEYATYFNELDRTVLSGKRGRLHEMINTTESINIKIHEV